MNFAKQTGFASVCAVGLVLAGATGALAGTVTGGSLLSHAGADQLETWLGVSDQDFTNIWSGDAGVGTAASFHAAVDGTGPTFSIYDVTLGDGSSALIGGYTGLDWAGSGYAYDSTAFIFNLTTGEAQFTQDSPQHALYRNASYFATFGGGHDIFGGTGTLATCGGAITISCDGYTRSHSFDNSQGQISIAGDSGAGSGDSGVYNRHIVVKSLETYSFTPTVAPVPLPAGGLLLITALGGLAAARRRKS